MFYHQYLHHTTCISDITHYVSKYNSKSLSNAHWNLLRSQISMELSPEFHGTFLIAFEQHLWFHGNPWNLRNKTSSSIEFHGILLWFKVPWNSNDFFPYSRVPRNFMEFHGNFNFPLKNPRNSMELDKFDILTNRISKYCCWYLIDDYMLFG